MADTPGMREIGEKSESRRTCRKEFLSSDKQGRPHTLICELLPKHPGGCDLAPMTPTVVSPSVWAERARQARVAQASFGEAALAFARAEAYSYEHGVYRDALYRAETAKAAAAGTYARWCDDQAAL